MTEDWLQEEDPSLLGAELFALFQSGGLALEVADRKLLGATVSTVVVPSSTRKVSFHTHHVHFVVDDLLARPAARTLEAIRLVERDLGDAADDGVRFVPNALLLATKSVLRANLPLKRLEAGDFERPGRGKAELSTLLAGWKLDSLQLVFTSGVRGSLPDPEPLQSLTLGWLSSAAQLGPLNARFPSLRSLAVGLQRRGRLLRALPSVLQHGAFPALRHVRLLMVDGPEPATEAADASAALGPLLTAFGSGLETFVFDAPVEAAAVVEQRSRLRELQRVELLLTDGTDAELVQQAVPHATIVNAPP